MNAERLLKLAAHLESGKLFHDVFNMQVFSAPAGDADQRAANEKQNVCRTAGCALGECKVVFPGEVALQEDPMIPGYYLPVFWAQDFAERGLNPEWCVGFAGAELFFDLHKMTIEYLFAAGAYANDDVTPAQVAQRIRDVVAIGKDLSVGKSTGPFDCVDTGPTPQNQQ